MRRRSLATLASWLLAVAILGLLVWRVDRTAALAALASAHLGRYALAAIGFVAIWLALDAFILSWLFGRLGAKTRWLEMVRFRGATYLFLLGSLHLANAALVGLVHRRTGMSLARATASMLVLYVGDLAAVGGFAFLASLASASPVLVLIRPVLAALALAMLALFGIGLALRTRLAGRPFFGVVAALGPADVAGLIGLRALFYATFVAFAWLTLPAFDVHLPSGVIAASMPVVMSIAALPITPAGLGTTQAAMLALFGEHAEAGAVLAYALVYGLTLIALRLPIGAALAPGALWADGGVRSGA